jgi:hypothetical protein
MDSIESSWMERAGGPPFLSLERHTKEVRRRRGGRGRVVAGTGQRVETG